MHTIAFDTETRGLDWFDPDQRAFLITWADADSTKCAHVGSPLVQDFIDDCKAADRIVAHNLSFDVHHVREAIGFDMLELDAELHDTDLLSRVLYPEGQRSGARGGHGLKNLAKIYLREDAADAEDAIKEMAKKIGLRTIKQNGAYFEVWRAYPDVMEEYALADARYTWDLFGKFAVTLGERPAAQRIYELERAVAPILIRAEQHGIKLDGATVRRLHTEETTKCTDRAVDLEAEGFPTGGAGSEDALIEALQNHGVPLHRKTATGQLSTAAFALQEFEDDYPIVRTLQEWRRSEKLIGTYLGPMLGRRSIHPSFMQIGAWTGRMSCRRPNMQNLPRGDFRSVLVPRRGYSFVVADYDAIEVRLLAYYLGNEEYRDLVSRSDPHAWMATEIAKSGAAADWPSTTDQHMYEKGAVYEDYRSKAKNGLFAIAYGGGAPRITDMFKLDPGTRYVAGDWAVENGYKKIGQYKYEPARRLIKAIKDAIPGYANLNQRIKKKVETVGHVNTLMGRVQPVSRDKAYVGLDALIQGSAADIMKQGLVYVQSAIESFDARILLVVHDEVVIECKTGQAALCLNATEEAMIAAADIDPPLKVTGTTVKTHYGAAK